MKRGLFAALLLALVACGGAPPEPREITFRVAGMHCEDCAVGITAALAQRRGVLGTDVHFSNQIQTVRYDAHRLQADDITAIVAGRGFTVTPADLQSPAKKEGTTP